MRNKSQVYPNAVPSGTQPFLLECLSPSAFNFASLCSLLPKRNNSKLLQALFKPQNAGKSVLSCNN